MRIVPEIPAPKQYSGDIINADGMRVGTIEIGNAGTYLFFPFRHVDSAFGVKDLEFILAKLREANKLLP